MKQHNFNYFKLKIIQNFPSGEFESLEELKRFADTLRVKEIFITGKEEATPAFAVVYNGVLMSHSCMGFESIEDYQSATQRHFPDAESFYDADKLGYTNYDEYHLVKEAGINDRSVFDKMKGLGYITGYKSYCSLLESSTPFPFEERFNDPFELYQYAIKNSFGEYKEFEEAIKKGFADKGTYSAATAQGFPDYASYKDANSRGFIDYKLLQTANDKKIRDFKDLTRFADLQGVECEDCTLDQKLLLTLMSKLEQGKKISINKLYDMLQKALEEYRYSDTGQMPEWFTYGLEDKEKLISFLMKNTQSRSYGSYDRDGEYFQINKIEERTVVIDGSNVAHNSNGSSNSTPYLANILNLAGFLNKKGFREIIVIADASLKHRIADPEKMEKVRELTCYLESPGQTSADAFLISYVKKHNCLLISNDTFRDWKHRDAWAAANIDFYRLTFMIKDEEVLMPDLKG